MSKSETPPAPHQTDNDTLESRPQIAKKRSMSPASTARIRVKNRRKRYLDTHPEYFTSPSLELADPLAYDRLIRRFQTPLEREAEGRRKGYSGTLEADLWRSDAKISALSHPSNNHKRNAATGEIMPEADDEVPASKEEGMERWRREMEMRFLRGGDEEFEYEKVDESEEFDGREEEREVEERWFEEESPRWVGGSEVEEKFWGETGVQDF